jgi:hypothetical protein
VNEMEQVRKWTQAAEAADSPQLCRSGVIHFNAVASHGASVPKLKRRPVLAFSFKKLLATDPLRMGYSAVCSQLLTIEASRQSGLYAISSLKSRSIIPELGR